MAKDDKDDELARRLFEEKYGTDEEILEYRERSIKRLREEKAEEAKKKSGGTDAAPGGGSSPPKRKKILF